MFQLNDNEFKDIRDSFFKLTGARLRDSKKPLVISRLRQHIEKLGLTSFADYMKKIHAGDKLEIEYFINALTTNETFFFRHTQQFNYLYEKVMPYVCSVNAGHLHVWSAASSTGEEPYSIVMLMLEYFKDQKKQQPFTVYASDINSEVIAEAKEAIYDERALKEVPSGIRNRYFRREENSKDGVSYKVTEEVKRKVEFFQHNLQQASPKKDMDFIFLRNVLIYFERDIKEKVVNNLEPSLKPGGYFFISLAENLGDIKTSLKLQESGIFRR